MVCEIFKDLMCSRRKVCVRSGYQAPMNKQNDRLTQRRIRSTTRVLMCVLDASCISCLKQWNFEVAEATTGSSLDGLRC